MHTHASNLILSDPAQVTSKTCTTGALPVYSELQLDHRLQYQQVLHLRYQSIYQYQGLYHSTKMAFL